jgi:hypothetical protein
MGALSRHVAVGAVKITVQDLPVPPFPVSARHIAPRERQSTFGVPSGAQCVCVSIIG